MTYKYIKKGGGLINIWAKDRDIRLICSLNSTRWAEESQRMERESTQREHAVWNSRIQSNWPSERFCERNLYKILNSWTLLFIWISTLYIDASHYVTLKRSNLGKLLNGMKSLFQLYNHVFIKALTSQVYRKSATFRYIILKWSIPTCHMILSTKPFPKMASDHLWLYWTKR